MNVSSWPTRLVVVVASLRGRSGAGNGRQAARLEQHSGRSLAFRANTSTFTFVVYQRLDPTAPNYCPNHAHEAGVYIQFVLDHYDHLPYQTIFVQDHFADHNPDLLGWARCVKPVRARARLLPAAVRARSTPELARRRRRSTRR